MSLLELTSECLLRVAKSHHSNGSSILRLEVLKDNLNDGSVL